MQNIFLFYIITCLILQIPLRVNAQTTMTKKDCLNCHKETNAKQLVHVPSEESCKNCHSATGKPHPQKGVKGFQLVEPVPELCYSCHDVLNNKTQIHKPLKKGECLTCHEVHSSDESKLKKAALPGLCYVCHKEYQQMIDTAHSRHGIIKSGQSCVNCHSPHQSNQPKILKMPEKDLCLQCHNKPLNLDGSTISSIKAELERNKYTHSAIASAGCVGCHNPHATQQQRLLKEPFNSATYINGRSGKSIGLCFTCHDAGLLEKGNSLTGFRNREVNLHNVHVYKDKGRNCTNCHGIHSGPNPYLIQNTIPFGKWNMPLMYTKTELGGKCITACHKPQTYNRQ